MAFYMYYNTRYLILGPLSGYHFLVLHLEDRMPLPKKQQQQKKGRKKSKFYLKRLLLKTTVVSSY